MSGGPSEVGKACPGLVFGYPSSGCHPPRTVWGDRIQAAVHRWAIPRDLGSGVRSCSGNRPGGLGATDSDDPWLLRTSAVDVGVETEAGSKRAWQTTINRAPGQPAGNPGVGLPRPCRAALIYRDLPPFAVSEFACKLITVEGLRAYGKKSVRLLEPGDHRFESCRARFLKPHAQWRIC
jgi:hypothetical protein